MTTKTKIFIGILVIIVIGIGGWWRFVWTSINKGYCKSDIDCKFACGCGCIPKYKICPSYVLCRPTVCGAACRCLNGKCISWAEVYNEAIKTKNIDLCNEIKHSACRDYCLKSLIEKELIEKNPPELVLSLDDLKTEYYIKNADTTTKEYYTGLEGVEGFIDGFVEEYFVDFEKGELKDPTTKDKVITLLSSHAPLIIKHSVAKFSNVEDAREFLEWVRKQELVKVPEVSAPTVGNKSYALKLASSLRIEKEGVKFSLASYGVIFQEKNIAESIVILGNEEFISVDDVIDIARIVEGKL